MHSAMGPEKGNIAIFPCTRICLLNYVKYNGQFRNQKK